MTLQFQNRPLRGASLFLTGGYGRDYPVRPRMRLVARWQHGADGRLECRWQRQQTNFPSD